MWSVRATLKFGVELAPDHEGVILHFDDFHECAVRRGSRDHESVFLESGTEGIIEFVAVTVPLRDVAFAIGGIRFRPRFQNTGIGAQAQRSSFTPLMTLTGEEVHHIFLR